MKKTTCAVVIINKEGDILGCHSMGSVTYDFPKGCVEPGESDIDAAVRELKEEAGICVDKETLIDCGIYNHNREKYIHIFIKQVSEFPNLNSLYCTTYFERYGKQFPEIDGYKVIKTEDRNLFNRVLQNKFEIIDEFNQSKK